MAPSTRRKPTRDEIRNGWTEEKLAAYLAERDSQKAAFANQSSKIKRVIVENVKTSFDPHKWEV